MSAGDPIYNLAITALTVIAGAIALVLARRMRRNDPQGEEQFDHLMAFDGPLAQLLTIARDMNGKLDEALKLLRRRRR